MRTLIFVLILFSKYKEIWTSATVDLYVKSVKFTFNENYQRDMVFEAKVTRNTPTGLINFSVYQKKPLTDAFIDLKLFYRYGTIFRNYLVNKEGVEVCELFKEVKDRKERYQNPLANLFKFGMNICCKQLARGCPYPAGWYNITQVDLNATIAPLLPPVVPAGTYKLYSRIYFADNSTLNTLEGTGYVKPNLDNRAGDFSMLSMG